MTMTQRGVVSEATKSASSSLGTKEPSCPWAATSAVVRSVVRFHSATVWPLRARFRARLLPMTASPMTPTPARALMAHVYRSAGRPGVAGPAGLGSPATEGAGRRALSR
jgi:hypothetical protein